MKKIHENFSLEPFQAQEVTGGHEPRARKTQFFKVLCFKPNFRGRLNMTSEGTPQPNSIKKHLTNLFIHDSCEKHTFPPILSPSHTGSSKFSQMVSKFCILILVSSSMTRKPRKFFHQSSNHSFSLILHLPVDSLHNLQGKTMSFTGKLFQNQFWR